MTPTPTKNAVKIEVDRIQKEIKALQDRTSESLFDEILNFIECHDPIAYRKKIKGYRLAFNVRDKNFRIPESTLNKEVKVRNKETANEIKKKVQEMKDNRVSQVKAKEMEDKQKYDKNRNFFKKIHEKLRREKFSDANVDNKNTYFGVKSKLQSGQNNLGSRQHAKISLDVLKKMHYSDFNIGDEDDFKPTDIVGEEDNDSDDSIFEQYKNNNESNIQIPPEKIVLNKTDESQLDEKVIHLKQQIKTIENITTPRDKIELGQIKQVDRDTTKNINKTLISKYRSGRNVSNVISK